VKFPSRFRAPTNVPRYDGDTNPSVWLEDTDLRAMPEERPTISS
jgi:hypothetical protein